MINSTSIYLSDGSLFDYMEEYDFTYSLDNISSALSKVVRFGGHTHHFCSLAQHSVFVSYLVEYFNGNHDEIKQGLLHDAHEPYCGGDILTPFKNVLTEFKDIEKRIQSNLLSSYNLNVNIYPLVKKCDVLAFIYECVRLYNKDIVNSISPEIETQLETHIEKMPWILDLVSMDEILNILQFYNFYPCNPYSADLMFKDRFNSLFSGSYSPYTTRDNVYLEYNHLIDKCNTLDVEQYITTTTEDFLKINIGL